MRRLVIASVVLLVAAAVLVSWDIARFFERPLANAETVTVVVEPGMSFAAVTSRLHESGVIGDVRQSAYLQAYARLRGLAQRIQSGEYEIRPNAKPAALLQMLVSGDTRQYRLTVVEGWSFEQLRQALAEHPAIDARLADATDSAVMAALGAPDRHPEGRFLPDTYHFPRGTTDVQFLRRAYRAMESALQQVWAERDPGLPLDNPYQALILASIIEKETAAPQERRRIAGVFSRRLERGMLLQTDPTVIYGISDFDGNLRRSDLRADTPYNTYTRRGLPPTPIALPGLASLHAAVHPADGESLYFVSRGDGTHVFSETLAEHNRAVRRYQLGQ